ncbi:anti-sigma factor family protein [Rubripirellula reticaptiva]|nr:hypothetical protein [Rubripirellula reticaptiva]
MTFSQAHVDHLLSGYLDEALTSDEQAEVENWLRTDPTIGAQLNKLREMRKSLRLIASIDRTHQLDKGFAGRVVEAAVARARAEGLAEDHPLVRVSEHPTSLHQPGDSVSWLRMAGVIGGIAASVGIAVLAFGPDADDAALKSPPPTHAIAKLEPAKTPETVAMDIAISDSIPTHPSAALQSPDLMTANIAAATDQSPAVTPREPSTTGSMPTGSQSNLLQTDLSLASNLQLSNSPLMVVNIRETELGRARGAFRKSLRSAGIAQLEPQDVQASLQDAAVKAATQGNADDRVSVMYLRTTGKKFDQLHVQLLADEQGIESLQLSVTDDVKLLQKFQDAANEPHAIRHSNLVWLASDSDATQAVSRDLGNLQFLPMPAGSVGDSGSDIDVQIIVLIR